MTVLFDTAAMVFHSAELMLCAPPAMYGTDAFAATRPNRAHGSAPSAQLSAQRTPLRHLTPRAAFARAAG